MCWIYNDNSEPARKGTLSICLRLMNIDVQLYQPLDYKPLSEASIELMQCAIEYCTDGKKVISPESLDRSLDALYAELARRCVGS